jgi:hypothetical protein
VVRFVAVWSLGLLLSSAPVVLHLLNAEGLPPRGATEVMTQMAVGIEAATGRDVALDDSTRCEDAEVCAGAIGTRYATDDVLLVQLFGAVQTGRARVLLADRTGRTQRRVDLDFPRDDRQLWPAIFSGLANILFPAVREKVVVETTPDPPPDSGFGAIVAWTAVGVGVGLAAGGTAFRIGSNSTRDDVEGRPLEDPMRDELISSSNAQGLTSNLMFGAGAVSIASGLVYLLTR